MRTAVIVDVREPTDRVPRFLAQLGLTVETRLLWAGDYQVGDRAIVERKTVRGLHASLIAGTFWPQLGRLRQGARFAYLLIEGANLDDGPLTSAAIRGVCVAVMDLGVGVIRSVDAEDSALWLQRLAIRRTTTRSRDSPAYAQRPKREAGFPAAEAALGSAPGISRVCAQALLSHFGCLAAVAHASAEELQRVTGIGPARASALTETFHATTH